MELLVLNSNLIGADIIDVLESLIWTDRYCGYGDFEIYSSVNDKLMYHLQPDYYVRMWGSDSVMIIEGRQISSDVENGNRLIVTGRSLETLLDRRIIWGQTILTGNFQNGIQKLLNENIISPTIIERKISNFIFEPSTDPVITALTIEAQFTGDNLYGAIKKLCDAYSIGFRVTLNDAGKFVFKLYAGADRSYDQLVNPYVVFSPKFENLMNSNYVESKKSLKTVTLVAGEGEGSDRKTTVVGGGSELARREMFTDARDISQTVDSVIIPEIEYLAQLAQRGSEYLSENTFVSSFEGQVDTSVMFKYGEDFFMGDVVQIANEYGLESKSRVTEIVRSQSVSGLNIFPTFSTIE